VPFSGSSTVPSQLLPTWVFWLIEFHVVCGCVYIMWRPGVYPRKKPKLACNSEGTDELPEDGTQLLEHVGAAK
jgi:hypothetical protein